MNYALVAALGACTGLRSMTPIAVLCWFAWRQTVHLSGWRSFTASIVSVVVFTIAACGEYVGDKLPNTPARTAPLGLGARIVFGALVAVVLAQPLLLNPIAAAVVGSIGAVAGAYLGWFARTRTVAALHTSDLPVALAEDAITIVLSITFLHLAAVHGSLFVGNDGVFGR
jgi:uncharacterized membrane protein